MGKFHHTRVVKEVEALINLDVCLLLESMSTLESDEEFMDAVSLSH